VLVSIKCFLCGNESQKERGEINRQLRKNPNRKFFCGGSCSAKHNNEIRGDKNYEIKKICPQCKEEFPTTTGKNEATFCSRSCASKGSVTNHRREKARETGLKNNKHIMTDESRASSLRSREMWKYSKTRTVLDALGVEHQFEYPLNGKIFDLALFDLKLFIEFDGRYHSEKKQSKLDKDKESIARSNGWDVSRIQTPDNTVIDPRCILHLIT